MPETIPHIPPDSTPEELYKSDRAMQRFIRDNKDKNTFQLKKAIR